MCMIFICLQTVLLPDSPVPVTEAVFSATERPVYLYRRPVYLYRRPV